MTDTDSIMLDRETLEAFVEEWKPILSLQAWKIVVKLVSCREFEDVNTLAECRKNIEHKQATIPFNRDTTEASAPNFDAEELVVHELLHCVMDPPTWYDVSGNTYQTMLYEQSVNDVARALITLKRAGKQD